MNPQTWITQRQHRAQLSPAEWHAARLALTDQLAELDADAPVMLHPARDLFTTPHNDCPWFVPGEREKLDRETFYVAYFRKDAIGSPQYRLFYACVTWRNGELELTGTHALRKFGPGWRAAVMAAHLVDPRELRSEVAE